MKTNAVEVESKNHKAIKGSMRVGRGLDRAIGQCVKLLKKYPHLLTIDSFSPQHAAGSIKLSTKSDRTVYQSLCKRRNPYFQMFLSWCKSKKCTPVADQYPVAHPALKLGTMIDVVVYNAQSKQFHGVECKTGFENYLFKATKEPMNAPFEDQPDHAHNQNHLQVALTHELYNYTMSRLLPDPRQKIPIGPMYYLNFNSHGIDEYNTPEFMNRTTLNEMFKVLMKREKKA